MKHMKLLIKFMLIFLQDTILFYCRMKFNANEIKAIYFFKTLYKPHFGK